MPRGFVETGFRRGRTARWLSWALWLILGGALLLSIAVGFRALSSV